MKEIITFVVCFAPTFIISFIMLDLMKRDYSVRFPDEFDSHTIRAHTDGEAKRAAKRLMRKRGHTSFQLRRC